METVSWLDAVKYCNARSKKEGLAPAYKISGKKVTWKKKANGYRLPTEAEWEYACRAGTVTPFNTENSVSAKEVNYYGDYPYEIEDYYFTEEKLETKPGVYREKTVSVKSFSPNAWGLYNMHGNVSEWVWDYYGTYGTKKKNPTGPKSGNYRVYRGGGWNDFAKHTRSAYRAAGRQEQAGFNVGIRLVRNVVKMNGAVGSSQKLAKGKTVIPFCSNGGGKFGQTLTAIAKLLPNTMMGEGMTVEYDGGSSMPSRVKQWLKKNGIQSK